VVGAPALSQGAKVRVMDEDTEASAPAQGAAA